MSIEVRGLGKSYRGGFTLADVSFTVEPGQVVGFLGPNGAGKSTTLRLALGLERPDTGDVTFDGTHYTELGRPLLTVGSLLDTSWIYSGQTVQTYLRWVAASNAIDRGRVPEVLDRVGLTSVTRRKVGALSMGMKQRLGLAAALLGNPKYLIFDEPLNGLDPEGIIWMRKLIRRLADEGRGVLLSSHQLGEVSQTADSVVMIAAGQLRGQGTVAELTASQKPTCVVRVAEPAAAVAALDGPEVTIVSQPPDSLLVQGLDAATVTRSLVEAGVQILSVSDQPVSLETIFLDRVSAATEHRGSLS